MDKNLKRELAVMDTIRIKPNYAARGRKYGMISRKLECSCQRNSGIVL